MRRVCARFRRRNRASSWPSESFGISVMGTCLACLLVIVFSFSLPACRRFCVVVNEAFSSLADGSPALLALKGPLAPRHQRAPLTAASCWKFAPPGRKSKNKKASKTSSSLHDLGEIANRRLSQLQQQLPF